MNKFEETFSNLKKEKRPAFMPFVVAGFPNEKVSLEAAMALASGADLLEIGFPYSDPLADGPVIQSADVIALKNGMSAKKAFVFIAKLRKYTNIPITILVYANVVYQYGIEKFYRDSKKCGIDGVLIPDVPVEESQPFVTAASKSGVMPIFLVTQTTGNKRLKQIITYAKGYLYVVSILGVTGARKNFDAKTTELIKRLKKQTNLPLAIGFGISNKDQVQSLYKAGADGVIVGSALVKLVAESKNKTKLLKRLASYGKTLVN